MSNLLLSKIDSGLNVVNEWENEELLQRTRSEIPFADLMPQVAAHQDHAILEEQKEILYQSDDLFLSNLCKWFQSIMTWVNNPPCELCLCENTKLSHIRGPLTPDEIQGKANRVEVYFCPECNAETTLFPRYNSVSKLLSTKQGRCGEYANPFGLFCRASGFETRYILDFSDHVWVEVWSNRTQRWIMADGCEGVIDSPSMYEKGWGKESLSYILAFTPEQITDVTRRYTRKYNTPQFQERRKYACPQGNSYSDMVIAQVNSNLRNKSRLAAVVWDDMINRSKREELFLKNTEMTTEWEEGLEYHQGRLSGALCWRISRNEVQMDCHGQVQETMAIEKASSVNTVKGAFHRLSMHISKLDITSIELQCEKYTIPSKVSMRFNSGIMPLGIQKEASLEDKITAFETFINQERANGAVSTCPFVGFTTKAGQPIYLITEKGYPFYKAKSLEDETIYDAWTTLHYLPKTQMITQMNEKTWSKDVQMRRVREIFDELVKQGMNPNEAGAKSINQMVDEMKSTVVVHNFHFREDESVLENDFEVDSRMLDQILNYIDEVQERPWDFTLRNIKLTNAELDDKIASSERGLEFLDHVRFDILATNDGFIASIPVWKDLNEMRSKVQEYGMY